MKFVLSEFVKTANNFKLKKCVKSKTGLEKYNKTLLTPTSTHKLNNGIVFSFITLKKQEPQFIITFILF